MTTALFLIGRVLLGGFFLYNAYKHFTGVTGMAGYAATKGVPYPKAAIIGSGALLLIAGLSIITGYAPGIGIIAGILFLVPVTLTMHAFWKEADPMQRSMQKIQFSKNTAILGALLMFTPFLAAWPAAL